MAQTSAGFRSAPVAAALATFGVLVVLEVAARLAPAAFLSPLVAPAVVALAAIRRGRAAGLISTGIFIAYFAIVLSVPGAPFRYSVDDRWRLVTVLLVLPATALLASRWRDIGPAAPGRRPAGLVPSREFPDFLAQMAHELTTPLNIVLGYLELLSSGIPEPVPSAARAQAERARASAAQLLHLIEDVLTYARLQAGQERVHASRFDLTGVVRDAAHTVAPAAREKGLEWRVRLPEAPAFIHNDPEKTRRIVVELLTNAVKFTDAGRVQLDAAIDGTVALIRVSDTGVGMGPTELSHVFEPFWQADASLTRRTSGSGLGLHVAQGLARLIGGDIDVRSDIGTGSTFSFRIPTQRPGI